jgi:LPS O-antigen subunit length determinant protein (WzzB/FepE family)
MIDKDMDTKEKAKELIDKYFDLVEAHTAEQQEDNARDAASITCDEVLNALEENRWQNRLMMDYWEEVKKEINT